MNLERLIERCCKRHANPLKQAKTKRITYNDDKDYPYRFEVCVAKDIWVRLEELTEAGISYNPIRSADHEKGAQCPEKFTDSKLPLRTGKVGWDNRFEMRDWKISSWNNSYGLQIFTGKMSDWRTALDFEYKVIQEHPDAVLECIINLFELTDMPLLLLTKSGGLRYVCLTPEYVHPRADKDKKYIYRYVGKDDNGRHAIVEYLEIFGVMGQSRYDNRYEILTGDVLTPPVIDKDVLFEPIDALKAKIHEPAPVSDNFQSTKYSKTSGKLGSKHTANTSDADDRIEDIVIQYKAEEDEKKRTLLYDKVIHTLAELSHGARSLWIDNFAKLNHLHKTTKTDIKKLVSKEVTRIETERANAKKQSDYTEQERQRLQALENLSPDAILLTDEKGKPRQPRELHDEVFDRLLASEKDDPNIFFNDGYVYVPQGSSKIRVMNKDMISHELTRRFSWYECDNGNVIPAKQVPDDVIRQVSANPRKFTDIPRLHTIVSHPLVIARKSEPIIYTERGYVPELETFILQDIEGVGQLDSVENAKAVFLEPFKHFPFESETDLATAVGYALTLLVRHLIDGHTPFFHFGAFVQGTGKTLLCQQLHHIVEGKTPPQRNIKMPFDYVEIERVISSQILAGTSAFLFDNIRDASTVDSVQLAELATATRHSIKVLFEHNRDVESKCVWAFSGNSLIVSGDMARRTVHINLQSKMPHPERRKGLPKLDDVVKSERSQLLSALITPVYHWIKDGQPVETSGFGSFTEWEETINGILNYWDLSVKRESLPEDHRRTAFNTFIMWVWKEFKGNKWRAKDVIHLAFGSGNEYDQTYNTQPQEALLELAGARKQNTQTLGYLLRELHNKSFYIPSENSEADDILVRVKRIPDSSPMSYVIEEVSETDKDKLPF